MRPFDTNVGAITRCTAFLQVGDVIVLGVQGYRR